MWNMLGLASRKDAEELSNKMEDITKSLEGVIQQNQNMMAHLISSEERMEMEIKNNIDRVIEEIKRLSASNSQMLSAFENRIDASNGRAISEMADHFQNIESRVNQTNIIISSVADKCDMMINANDENGKVTIKQFENISKSIERNSKNAISKNELINEQVSKALKDGIDGLQGAMQVQFRCSHDKLIEIENLSMHINEALRILWINDIVEDLESISIK